MSRSRRRRVPALDRPAGDARLARGVAELGVTLSETDRGRLLDYVEALAAWNATHNLTAIRDPQAMLVRHILDCLAIAPHIDAATRIADIGTGPGLPGLVLATLAPESRFWLVESNHKKIAFLRHARRTLDLANVEVVASRVEDWAPETGFDWIVTRAFASAAQTVHHAGHLIGPGTRLGLMKGRDFEAENAELPEGYVCQGEHEMRVPGLEGERRFVVIVRRA